MAHFEAALAICKPSVSREDLKQHQEFAEAFGETATDTNQEVSERAADSAPTALSQDQANDLTPALPTVRPPDLLLGSLLPSPPTGWPVPVPAAAKPATAGQRTCRGHSSRNDGLGHEHDYAMQLY